MKASPLGTPPGRGLRKAAPAVAKLGRSRSGTHARAAAVCAPCVGSRHDQGAAWFALIHGPVLALACCRSWLLGLSAAPRIEVAR